MKKTYLAVGVVMVTIAIVIAIVVVANQTDQSSQSTTDTKPTVTSSTTPTAGEQTDNETTDSSTSDETESDKDSSAETQPARYQTFSAAAFRGAAGHVRLLFFYDKAHAPSAKLDSFISANLAELPRGLRIFKAPYQANKDLAEQFGVSAPGSVLKFDTNNQLTGIYIATDEPSLASFKKVLALD